MTFWPKNKLYKLWIILFSGLDDHGLLLRNLIDISLQSVCGIFRSGPSGTLWHYGREERGQQKGTGLQCCWCCRPWSPSSPAETKTVAQRLVGRKLTSRTTLASLESSALLLPQCGSRYVKQKAPATPTVGTAVTQWRGGRRRTSGMTASTTLESDSLLLPPSTQLQYWRVLEGTFLKIPHTDGGKTSRRFLKIRPRSSSPENKVIQSTSCETNFRMLFWFTCVFHLETTSFFVKNFPFS